MLEATTYADRPWRTGRKLNRTIYAVEEGSEDRSVDHLLGMLDSWLIVRHVVDLHNADLERRRSSSSSTDSVNLRELAEWLVSLDDPANLEQRQTVSLTEIIPRARQALRSPGEESQPND